MALKLIKIFRVPLVITVTLLVSIFLFFSIRLSKVSVERKNYDFAAEEVGGKVDIYSDQYGIRHIIAQSETDLYYAAGFAQAADRLWQMDILRRKAEGRMSEVLGEKFVEFDKLMKRIDIRSIAAEAYARADAKTKSLLRFYSAGINKYMELAQNNLSFEFSAAGYKPERWQPQHTYEIMRFFGLSCSQAFNSELTIGRIFSKLRPEKFHNMVTPGKNSDLPASYETTSMGMAGVISGNFPGCNSGSNVIAVGRNTKNNALFVAGDPHMELTLPALWTETIMTLDGFNICGLSIPGIPMPLIGRNDHLAWSIANAKTDDFDYFAEKTDKKKTYSETDASGGRSRITYTVDSVRIAGKNTLLFYKAKNHRSCFLNNENEDQITFDWTGRYLSDEAASLHKLAFSRNTADAARAFDSWGTPSLDIVLADNNGIKSNIVGFIPIRPEGQFFLPLSGNVSANNWKGVSNKREFISHPEQYYIFANNYKEGISDRSSIFFDAPFRKKRLEDLVTNAVDIDRRQMQIFQNDVYSEFAREVTDTAVQLLKSKYKYLDTEEREAFNHIKNWKFILSDNSAGKYFYKAFIDNLFTFTFRDELGETLFEQYRNNINLLLNSFSFIFRFKTNIIFDDVSTSIVENRDYIILKAFKKAAAEIKHETGKKAALRLEHLLASHNFIKPLLTYTDIIMPGDATTVNYYHRTVSERTVSDIGVSGRFITDIRSPFVYMSIPGGTSGDPIDANFADQLRIWSSGGYIEVRLSSYPAKSFKRTVRIRPA